MDLDTLFAGMQQSALNDRGEFFAEGLYTVEAKSFEFRDGFKGKSFIAKFAVVESNNPDTPVGVTRSWIVKLDKAATKAQAMGDIKSLMFALSGVDPRQVKSPELDPGAHEQATKLFKASIDETYAKTIGVDPRLLVGRRVRLEATTVKTKATADRPNGGEFTRHSWTPCVQATAA